MPRQKPNKPRIQLWVDALRSDKFKQATRQNYIAENNSYCCLGVACQVAEDEGAPGILGEAWRGAFGMTRKVRQWYGLSDSNPLLLFLSGWGPVHATTLNDVLKWDFHQIADTIEERFIKETPLHDDEFDREETD